jgi:hypothetical protein
MGRTEKRLALAQQLNEGSVHVGAPDDTSIGRAEPVLPLGEQGRDGAQLAARQLSPDVADVLPTQRPDAECGTRADDVSGGLVLGRDSEGPSLMVAARTNFMHGSCHSGFFCLVSSGVNMASLTAAEWAWLRTVLRDRSRRRGSGLQASERRPELGARTDGRVSTRQLWTDPPEHGPYRLYASSLGARSRRAYCGA